jgi:hypothetical protein
MLLTDEALTHFFFHLALSLSVGAVATAFLIELKTILMCSQSAYIASTQGVAQLMTVGKAD